MFDIPLDLDCTTPIDDLSDIPQIKNSDPSTRFFALEHQIPIFLLRHAFEELMKPLSFKFEPLVFCRILLQPHPPSFTNCSPILHPFRPRPFPSSRHDISCTPADAADTLYHVAPGGAAA